jgi:cbb3-type cytochrome oxidase maturation protein
MDVIIALVLISLMLVVAGLVFFFTRLFDGDFEHGDRLSLLPLADDTGEEKTENKKDDDKQDKIDSNAQGQSAE